MRPFEEIIIELNLHNIFNEDGKKIEDEEKMAIYRRYVKRLEELNQEVAINEIFLFSILTGRIKAAKAESCHV